MSDQTCRWGILGTAGIARKNWHSLRNCENATLVAVASRSSERAQQYIDECQSDVSHSPAPRAIGSYEELLFCRRRRRRLRSAANRHAC